jgi:tRNA(Ile)-lysidine synthase
VGAARNAVRSALEEAGWPPLVLVACSGGPDSLALAAAVAHFARRGSVRAPGGGIRPLRAGAVVVDHQLQEDSGEVARTAAAVLAGLGLSPVRVVPVEVRAEGEGPEAAARTARHTALTEEARALGAGAVLLGHTLDDQAEQVLLGLARGSGPRALGAMRPVRGLFVRPFLGLRRAETLSICAAEGLAPWFDPTNEDLRFMRSRVRASIMPFLEAELGPGVAEALSRTAALLGADADFLDAHARSAYQSLAEVVAPEPPSAEATGGGTRPHAVVLPGEALRELPPAIRGRVIALAVAELGGEATYERLRAVERLLDRRGSAGPVEVPGHVSAYRRTASGGAAGSGGISPGVPGALVLVSHR